MIFSVEWGRSLSWVLACVVPLHSSKTAPTICKTPTEAVRFGTSPRQFSQPHGEQAAAEGEGDTAFEDRAACRCREELRHAGVPSGPHRCNRRVR